MLKLVRVDSGQTPPLDEDLTLTPGLHPFGRGIFLGCEDKRVSRRHGQLEVADRSVVLTALHDNPCFVVKKGTTDTQLLKQGAKDTLAPGDRFGLLPKSFWYELVLSDAAGSEDSCTEEANYSADVGGAEEKDDLATIDFELNEVPERGSRPESPSLLAPGNTSASLPQTNVPAATQNDDEEEIEFPEDPGDTDPPAPDSPFLLRHNGDSAPGGPASSKRAHSPDAPASPAKLARADPAEDVKPSTSALDAAMAAAAQAVDPTAPVKQEVKAEPDSPAQAPPPPLAQAQAVPAAPGRERCMYGAQCYRRNPQHKLAFSHPADADWGAGGQAACPWGAGCTRRDPRHWRDHTHPPGTSPPAPGHNRGTADAKRPRRRPKRQDSSDSDEATDPVAVSAANVLPSKRKRKQVKRPSWSGSESDEYDMEDPFMTDGEEDEWLPDTEPPSDYTQSQ